MLDYYVKPVLRKGITAGVFSNNIMQYIRLAPLPHIPQAVADTRSILRENGLPVVSPLLTFPPLSAARSAIWP